MARDAARRSGHTRCTLILCCAWLAGCTTHLDPARDSAISAEPFPPGWVWPARDTTTADRLRTELPSRVPVVRVLLGKLGQISRMVRTEEVLIAAERAGPGLLVESKKAGSDATTLQFVSHDPLLEPAAAEGDVLDRFIGVHDGHIATLRRPKGPSRGTTVVYHGLGGFLITGVLADTLVDHGWTVLEAWFPLLYVDPVCVRVTSDDPPGATIAGADLAMLVDSHLSEHAYATEAMLDRVRQSDPTIDERPLVLIGFSGGGLILPAVHARLGDAVSGAIIGYAGANLPRVGHESFLTDGGLRVDAGRSHDPAHTRELVLDAYQARTRLDPYNAATLLADKPVLMFHASMDRIVPSATGEVLYERLGTPTRLTTHAGHRVSVILLLREMDRICAWLDERFPPGGPPSR